MKVMKFGGSTIKNPMMIKKVGDIIQKQEGDIIVVVSALYGQTSEIREYLQKIRTKTQEIDTFIQNIRSKHENLIKGAIVDKEILSTVTKAVDKHILKLERLLYGVAYTEELTPKTADLILSSGERMSAYIMEGVLLDKKVRARAFEADEIGVVTDGLFGNATADLEKTGEIFRKNLLSEMKNGFVPVITGFFGCDEKGRTTTFGKNGSDYSAAVIANAVNADYLELWKDVDGFMSADPSMIENAYCIEELSYDEAAELAYFGISLLHPRTVEPARLKNIPIVIKNILKPENKGTAIVKKGNMTESVVKSVVYSKDLVEIKVSGTGAGYRPGILSSVTGALSRANINIYSVTTSHTHLSLLIYENDIKRCEEALSDIHSGAIESIDFKKDIALVCVVGEGARDMKGLAGKIFTAVASSGVNVEMISAGASSVASHFIIKKECLRKTIEAIHSAFCKG